MFENKKIHFIGIGGISMSGIAEIVLSKKAIVTGYDLKESDITKKLINQNIDVYYKPNTSYIDKADIIVYTAAIPNDFEELKYAKDNNKNVYERSEFLGILMKEYENVLCISGTHGKSTTTGMIATIFMLNNLNPTISIGAMLPLINGNYHIGGHKYFIAEACEYVDSFLDFNPTSEIILNIDDDHLDYFKNLDNIIASFNKFIHLLPKDGYLIVNNDDKNVLKASYNHKKTTYGINNNSDYMAKDIVFNNLGHPSYDLYINNKKTITVNLSVPGMHNVYNSLASISLCHKYIDDISLIVKALKSYKGVGRRFEYLGKYKDAYVFDDYAHHPREIKTTLESVKGTHHNKNYAIFQAHTYSRTKDHLKDFADVLKGFDNIIVAKIFAAREENIYNVKEEDLVNLIKKHNKNVCYIDSFDEIKNFLDKNIQKDDIIITIGAGDINKLSSSLTGG